jgi:hypothetical protein
MALPEPLHDTLNELRVPRPAACLVAGLPPAQGVLPGDDTVLASWAAQLKAKGSNESTDWESAKNTSFLGDDRLQLWAQHNV